MQKSIKLFGATCAALEYARACIHGICGTAIQIDDCDIQITPLSRPPDGRHIEIKGNFFEGDESIRFAIDISLARNERGRWVPFNKGEYITIRDHTFYVDRMIAGECETISFAKVTEAGGTPLVIRSVVVR